MSDHDEKTHDIDVTQSSAAKSVDDRPDVDAAWKFINDHGNADDTVNLAALRRKIDWHIVPLMFLCYTMQFLDKVILNVRTAAPSCLTFLSLAPLLTA